VTRSSLALAAALALTACARAPRMPLEGAARGETRLVIDVREPAVFATGHAPGALNVQTGYGQLAGRIRSWVPDAGTPIAIRATSTREAEEAAAVLRDLGYRDIALAPEIGGETLELTSLDALAAQLASDDPPIVLDIRTAGEFATGTIPGAITIDQDHGPTSVAGLDPARRYVVICEGGWRSSQLASWMKRNGYARVSNAIDGMAGWRKRQDDR
jgi:rhodanese-related sulfurtransferase